MCMYSASPDAVPVAFPRAPADSSPTVLDCACTRLPTLLLELSLHLRYAPMRRVATLCEFPDSQNALRCASRFRTATQSLARHRTWHRPSGCSPGLTPL